MPTPASPTTRRNVVLHIGSGKTGTSSLQAFLGDNRERLAEVGDLYPMSPGKTRHALVGLSVKSEEEAKRSPYWYRLKEPDHETFRRRFHEDLRAEIDSSDLPRVILSDEVLFHLSGLALERLGELMGSIGDSLRVVVYLRRQDDHMVSRYQQAVKAGMATRLSEYVNRDLSWFYDYHERLRMHQRFLSPAEFVVRRFERDSFVNGSLFQDFLDAAGTNARAREWRQVDSRNESLDAESVEILRLLNLCKAQQEGGSTAPFYNRRLIRELARASTGPTLTLPEPILDEFMAQFEESNRRVAQEFLGDPGGQLFRVPRKSDHTTSDQRLDPARLDHFIALLGIPEEIHAPLRTLAEKEAQAH